MEQDTTQNTGAEHVEGDLHRKNTGMAVVAYILFFVPLLTDAKDDPFVKFHVKQGFVVFLCAVAASILSVVSVLALFGWILHVAVLVLIVLGIMNAVHGKEEQLPLIGHIADNFHF